ncbi:MAG: ABC transporter ATP-binding protein [Planctomycetaceae bacterium]|jgi:lipoprotein-releasing system ATP-binding protein|nr:ABC transporter ATP-binding protein [Planctomycetaceae bacterium]
MSKHAVMSPENLFILNPSIKNIDDEWNMPINHVEFNRKVCQSAVPASELINEVGTVDFLDNEKIVDDDNTAKNNKPTQSKLEHDTKITSDNTTETGTEKFKTVLQNLQKIRDRLVTDEQNETTTTENQNTTTDSNNSNNLSIKSNDCVEGESNVEVNVELEDNVDAGDAELEENTIGGNILDNINRITEKRTPEERLMEFSPDDIPSFEILNKTRVLAEKLAGKNSTENNLTTNNKPEIKNNSMPIADNSGTTNIITINPDLKNMDIDRPKIADNEEQNIVAQNVKIKKNITTKNNNNKNVPLVLSIFDGSKDQLVEAENKGKNENVGEKILTSDELLITRGLEKSYFKSKLKIPVLNGVNFAAYSGEFVSITGQSGSGKSTLLHLLGTLDKPDSGEIIFDGQRVDNLSVSIRDKLRNMSIGFIFQFYNLLPEFTALENVLSPLMIREGIWGYFMRRRTYIDRAKELLDRVGLLHRLRHRPNELSGGEIQRVAIARSLIIEPKLLLADEPTGNLDSASAKEIIRILRELKEERNLTIVMVTHDQSIASSADRVVKMSDGIIN